MLGTIISRSQPCDDGPAGPNHAQSLAMVFHELATTFWEAKQTLLGEWKCPLLTVRTFARSLRRYPLWAACAESCTTLF
jgi:hypothetical protein